MMICIIEPDEKIYYEYVRILTKKMGVGYGFVWMKISPAGSLDPNLHPVILVDPFLQGKESKSRLFVSEQRKKEQELYFGIKSTIVGTGSFKRANLLLNNPPGLIDAVFLKHQIKEIGSFLLQEIKRNWQGQNPV